jgi:antirestriction protein ArdC
VRKLEDGVKEVFESKNYEMYMKAMACFHKYSAGNVILIWLQKPNATMVAGYKTWLNKFNRQVKKGEQGISILAPMKIKVGDEEEEEKKEILRFRAVHVFDVTQTEGQPIPSIVETIDVTVENYTRLLEILKDISTLPVLFKPLDPSLDGVCKYDSEITIREGMSQSQTVCALIHEMAHAALHKGEADRVKAEIEAESISFVVCNYYGIETGKNSFGYIASWSADKDTKVITASLAVIQHMSADLIEKVRDGFGQANTVSYYPDTR